MKDYIVTIVITSVFTLCLAAFSRKVEGQDDNTGVTTPPAEEKTNAQKSSPLDVTNIPIGYRDWKVISVAHEAGDLNDIRAILGNDIAMKAYREGKLSFPEGAIIGRIAWSYASSEENNKAFGRDQSFVAGSPTDVYLQFMVKDSKKYASTGGWGYSSFGKDGKPTDAAAMKSCCPCHEKIESRDFIFTRYSP